MRIFSGWILQIADSQFRKDQNGRAIFLPYGPRRAGYYVDSAADDQKIKPLVAIYTMATVLFQVLGFLSSYLLTQAAIFPDHPTSRAGKMEFALIVYSISALTFLVAPRVLLWKLYQELIPGLCSSLSKVDAESVAKLARVPNPLRRRAVIVLAFVSLTIGLTLFLLVSRRPVPARIAQPALQR